MFAIRVHSIDVPREGAERGEECGESAGHAFPAECSPSTAIREFPPPLKNPKIQETRGILHLFRNVSEPPPSVRALPAGRSTLLCILAVPNYMTYMDFVDFCGSHVEHMLVMLAIRDDGVDDRHTIFITFSDQNSADTFYRQFNGKKFPSAEAEVCHILFSMDVLYTESSELSGTPPLGLTELPSCPACLERLDQDISGIPSTRCGHSFHCSCFSRWMDSSCPVHPISCSKVYRLPQVCRFCQQETEKPTCSVCGTSENLWICVICGFVGCGRYKEGHSIKHWKDTRHSYSLDLENQRIWDYVGDSYVHRLIQSKSDGKLVDLNSSCGGVNDNWETCACSEDSGISKALLISKVEAIVDEYNCLLAGRLHDQRQYYESLLLEAKEERDKALSEALENAVTLKLQELQLEYEKCVEEKRILSDINQKLMKDQENWKNKIQEAEERERLSLRSKDEHILDLEEQVRDIKVYIEAQKALGRMANSEEIRGGTVLGVQPPSSSGSKRTLKSNRRRR